MKNEAPELKGKTVYLRRPEAADFREFTAMARKSERFHRGLIRMARTADEFKRFLDRSLRPENEVFLICRGDDDSITGTITLSQIFYGPFRNAYLGYGLGSEYTGHGFMTEAVRLLVRYGFTTLRLHRIEANVQPGNIPSIAVLKRAGFSQEGYSPRYLKIGGRWRDHERWAIIKENWKKTLTDATGQRNG
jgi:ribosomal-protein-alanine N-acetyltransferase